MAAKKPTEKPGRRECQCKHPASKHYEHDGWYVCRDYTCTCAVKGGSKK